MAERMLSKGSVLGWLLSGSLPLLPAFSSLGAEAPASAPEVRVTLQLELVVPGGGPVAGAVRARQAGKDGGERRIGLDGRGPVSTSLPPGTTWDLTGEVPGYWVRRETLTLGPPTRPVVAHLRLWPLGRIAGTIKPAEPQVEAPKEVIVTTLPRHGARSSPAPKGSVACPVAKNGTWSCDLPAAQFDFSVAAKGFIPSYRFGVDVAPARATPVGVYELRRGASVAGWVEASDGVVDAGRCRVRLAPLVAARAGHGAEAIRRTAVEARVNERGFFQLAGVRPGSYALSVEQPGYASARLSLEVAGSDETVLRDPLVLLRPFAIEVAIDPPIDWRGRPWRVQLFRARDAASRVQAEKVYEGSAMQDGVALVVGQEPGKFSIRVGDSLGNWVIAEDDLTFTGAEKVRHEVAIHLIALRGTILLGREPLAGELWFGGTHGKTAVKMEADAKGKFDGFLARQGMWDLEIRASEGKLDTWRRVRVEADDKGRARLDVRIPATRVFGRAVLDEDSHPAAGAAVELMVAAQATVEVVADEQGAFEFRGTAEGPVELAASLLDPPRFSDRVAVVATADQPVGPVELRLHRSKKLAGTVGSPRGPVAGGSVDVVTLRPTVAFVGPVTTDLEGGFTATVPGNTEAALAIVSAPGNGLKAFEVPFDRDQVYLEVSPEAGTLEIELETSAEELEKKSVALQIYQAGYDLPLPVLYRWARTNGVSPIASKGLPRLTVPGLAPGAYQACLESAGRPAVAMRSDRAAGNCKGGMLGAGGVLRLRIGG
jgi:hypothetical protein